MVLNVLPIMGPRIISAAKTTMATKTRIRAYSTRPWPLSAFESSMAESPFFGSSPATRHPRRYHYYSVCAARIQPPDLAVDWLRDGTSAAPGTLYPVGEPK